MQEKDREISSSWKTFLAMQFGVTCKVLFKWIVKEEKSYLGIDLKAHPERAMTRLPS